MTVKELIEKLKDLPEDSIVHAVDDEGELANPISLIEQRAISHYEYATVVIAIS